MKTMLQLMEPQAVKFHGLSEVRGRKPMTQFAVILSIVGLMAGTGCVEYPADTTVGGQVEVAGPPPVALVDTVPPSPGLGYVWVGGAWDWRGQWVWDAGRWERPPHPGAVWVPHHYVMHHGHHTFVHGGWR